MSVDAHHIDKEFDMPELFLRFWISMFDRGEHDERGQTTAEYALVLIVAAAIAGLALAWATKTHTISSLFDKIVGKIIP